MVQKISKNLWFVQSHSCHRIHEYGKLNLHIEFHADNRVISKVRQTQHQNLEFGHTHGEFFFKPANKYINIQWGVKLKIPSILVVNLSFLFLEHLHCCYIYFHFPYLYNYYNYS
jgi:hypothetical protein